MTKCSNLLLMIAMLMVFAVGSPVSAQLYNNGAGALGSPIGVGVYADTTDVQYSMEGNTFVAPTTGPAYSISFAGLYYSTSTPGPVTTSDSFVISLYTTDATGAPDTSPTGTIVNSDLTDVTRYALGMGNSRTVYQFSGLLSVPLLLSAGQTYFLGISDTTNYEDFAVDLTNNPSAGGTVNYALNISTGQFDKYTGTPLAFTLTAPEPSEWALMGLGALGLLVARKMRLRFFAR